ncbi:hypothetical protein [Paracoccus sp. SSK6]|uniref:hypothetical protein n=1 Tax=Paracoccus sp. SSK6 TaxID=3143131 RepID=UPI00321A2B1A
MADPAHRLVELWDGHAADDSSLTGNGGVFHRRAVQFAHARAEMPRVSRWEGTDKGTVIFDTPADSHQFRIFQPFFDRFSIERIQPEPDQALLTQGAQAMTFPTAGPARIRSGSTCRPCISGGSASTGRSKAKTRRITLIVIP